MTTRFTIVGLGEALFDVFPDRQILGGAPLNVAFHAHQLAFPKGGEGAVVSRVGQDGLGDLVLSELRTRGVVTSYIQTDPDHDTGKVYVSFDERNEPSYEIVKDVAWDWLQFDPDLEELSRRCAAVCFGSLAQRNGQSRSTIERFLDAASRAVRLFDVNLRQNIYNRAILRRSCEMATGVKLNQDELPIVCDLLSVAGKDEDARAAALIRQFNLKLIVYTRGAEGTRLYTPTGRYEGKPVSYPAAEGADAVGAGDACTAAVLVGLVRRMPMDKIVDLANHAGAYVASQPGATPKLPDEILARV